MAQPNGAIISLATGTASDVVFSLDGKTVYVSRGGTVTAFDTASAAVKATYMLGTSLGGMDISADGKYLVAPELTVGPVINSGPFSTTIETYVYRLDLTTGTSAKFTSTTGDSYFYDASFMPNGHVVLTQNYPGSGFEPLTTLNVTTGTFTRGTEAFAQDGTLTATPDKTRILHLPSNISDAPLFIYTPGTGTTASHQLYADNVMGYNIGVQAISASGNLVAQGVGLNVYDGNLHYIMSLQARFPALTDVAGLAFSPDGSKLYVLDVRAREVFVINTSDWSMAGGYPVGSAVKPVGQSFGDALRVSGDGRYLSVTGAVSVQIIDLLVAVNDGPTNGADSLSGDSAGNYLYAFDGNDTIDGKGGADIMIGGRGDDKYHVDSVSDQVIERAGEGSDSVFVSINGYSLPYSVETLTLTGAATQAYGNEEANPLVGNELANDLDGRGGDDTLTGNGGADILIGGLGNDRMIGGTGNDIYYIDSPADVIVEQAAEGDDIVFASTTITLANNVERLTLQGGTESLNATGNALGNTIVGNAGDNVLAGGDGDDHIDGAAGNDTIDGGAGTDELLIAGRRSDFQITAEGGGFRLVDLRAGQLALGSDLVLNVEDFHFQDRLISAGELLAAPSSSETRFQLTMQNGSTATIVGDGSIFGSNGYQDVTILDGEGAISLDASFARGGDLVRLPGAAALYTMALSGSSAFFVKSGLSVSIPIGLAGLAVSFDDGVRELAIQGSSALLGEQVIVNAPRHITVPADGTGLPIPSGDPASFSQLIIALGGETSVSGNVNVFGTNGAEVLEVLGGTAKLDASFVRGGDTLQLAAPATDFAAKLVGSAITLESPATVVTIPLGTSGMTIDFDGDARILRYDLASNKALLGTQEILPEIAIIA